MNSLSAAVVRTSLVGLVIGFVLGLWLMVAPAHDLPVLPGMRLMHVRFLTVGFFTLMVMSVALWMVPAPPGQTRHVIRRRRVAADESPPAAGASYPAVARRTPPTHI